MKNLESLLSFRVQFHLPANVQLLCAQIPKVQKDTDDLRLSLVQYMNSSIARNKILIIKTVV